MIGRISRIRFTVSGLNVERFLRGAGEQRIPLTDVRRQSPRCIAATVREKDLPALQQLAERGGWQLVPGRRIGLGHGLEMLKKRWLPAAILLPMLLAVTLASRILWRIEIVDGGMYAPDLRAALAEMGVTVPLHRSSIDLGELRDALEWRYPEIAWVECGFRGISLVIRPVAGVPADQAADGGPCDIVASRDGVIHHIVTRAGTPVVSVGDVVRAGDVLIKGEERTADEGVRPVAARGEVVARVWLGARVTMSALQTETVYTGREQTVWTIRTPLFDLWPMPASPFEKQDVAVSEIRLNSLFLPVTLHVERRMEAEYTAVMRDLDEVRTQAQAAARRKLHEKLAPGESLIDIWGNCSMIDDENVLSEAIGEMLVEIGQRSPVMAVPDEQR